MKRDRLTEPLRDFSLRLSELRQQLESHKLSMTVIELVETLATTLEELRTAEDELVAQDEALHDAYQALDSAHQHYRELFDAAPWVYIVTDSQGVIQEVNREAGVLLRVERQHLIGKPLSIYLAAPYRAEFRQRMLSLPNEEDIQTWEAELQPRHEPTVPMAITCQVVKREGKVSFRWLFYDLRARRDKEAAEREQIFLSTFNQAAIGMAYLTPDGRWRRVNPKLTEIVGYTAEQMQQMNFVELVYANDKALAIEAHLRVLIPEQESVMHEQRLVRKDGSICWTNVTSSLVRNNEGEPLYIMAVIEDITARKQAELAEREQRTLAETLQDTAVRMTSSLQLHDVLDLILTSVRQVIWHDTTTIMLVEDHHAFVARKHGFVENGLDKLNETLSTFYRPIADVDLLQKMATSHQPLLMRDWAEYGDFDEFPQNDSLHGFLAAPILIRDELLGFILLQRLDSNFFEQAHATILQAFAAQAAVAIQNAYLYGSARELAVMEERHRLARDLHDAVTQTLFSSVIITESLPSLVERNPEKAVAYAHDLETLNRSAMAEMRILLMELRPEHLQRMTLHDSFRQLTEAARGRKALTFDLQIDAETNIPLEVKVALYRIAQEALNNIVKHSSATYVRIGLANQPDSVKLTIADDGTGFDTEDDTAGLGMTTMHERARSLGADLHIDSHLDGGTNISVLWKRAAEAKGEAAVG
jgi:PAS domain S-box-containing protein